MRKLGGVAILMQKGLISEEQLNKISTVTFLIGSATNLLTEESATVLPPFDDEVVEFLNDLSRFIMNNTEAKSYPDIVTFGFWIRRSSVLNLKDRFMVHDKNIHMGRGVIFHIAPSNVPINYGYSLVTGLLTGNINIVRIPSKDFPQVEIINNAINKVLEDHMLLRSYIYLVRYERNQQINDMFSSVADIRVVWGGDNTIFELRKSPLPARSGEITFADRYSIAIIDSDVYLALEDKSTFAEKFYNDTYLTDQNACTSPRIVVWIGKRINKAKEQFWEDVHRLAKRKYKFQPVMGVNKLTSSYLAAAKGLVDKIESHKDNYLVRVQLNDIESSFMELKDNSGYFFEYDCDNLIEIRKLCDDTRCQTIGYLCELETIMSLLTSGIRGVDRVVPIGRSMDYDLLWDGYNLYERMTRVICLHE